MPASIIIITAIWSCMTFSFTTGDAWMLNENIKSTAAEHRRSVQSQRTKESQTMTHDKMQSHFPVQLFIKSG